ncbi:MAG: helix-turn-helix transcriptional regulator [Bacteroidota bacterium]
MKLLRLKELLKEKGLTSKALADKLGVTPATVSNIARSTHFPKPELLVAIAEALDVRLTDLFLEEEGSEAIYVKRGDNFIKIGEIQTEIK